MIRLNATGVVILLPCLLVTMIIEYFVGFGLPPSMIIFGVLSAAVDLYLRQQAELAENVNRWIANAAGGFIVIGPAWVFGAVLIVAGILAVAGVINV